MFSAEDNTQDQVKKDLKESEKKYRFLAENISDVIWTADLNLRYTYVSPSAEKIYGYTAEEILSFSIVETLTPPSQDLAMRAFQEGMTMARQDGKDLDISRTLELESICKDGSTVWVEVKVSLLRDAAGQATGILGISRNITERKQAQQEAKEAHQRLLTILDSMDYGVYVADMETYELLFVNKYLKKLWGDIAGKKCWETIQGEQTGPCSFCTNDKLLDADGMPTGVYQWEYHNTKKNRWYECHDSALRWVDGRMVRMQGLLDITERKQAEADRHSREEEFRALAENNPDVVARFDRNYRRLYVNPAAEKFAGIPRERLMGKTHASLNVPEGQVNLWHRTLEEVFQSGKGKEIYYSFVLADSLKYFHSRVTPEFDPDGTVETVLAITRDVTALKEMEASLLREQARLGQLHLRSLPEILPSIPGLALAASYHPAPVMRGDYYNAILWDGQLLVYLVDINETRDDGLIQSLYVRNFIEKYLSQLDNNDLISPALILRQLKEQYLQDNRMEDCPLCVVVAVLETEDSASASWQLHYASLGTCASPLFVAGDGDFKVLKMDELSTGAAETSQSPHLDHTVPVLPGSTIIFTTDGLAKKASHNNSYKTRLRELCTDHYQLAPELICRAIDEAVDAFCGESPLPDDFAYLVVQIPEQEQRLGFSVESDFQCIEEAKEKVFSFLSGGFGLETDLIDFHELLVNAIEHGNKRDGGKKVSVDVMVTSSYYRITVTDQGEGFNWRERINKEMDWESESERGRGIIMTRMMTDYLGYNKRGNRVTMINLTDRGTDRGTFQSSGGS